VPEQGERSETVSERCKKGARAGRAQRDRQRTAQKGVSNHESPGREL